MLPVNGNVLSLIWHIQNIFGYCTLQISCGMPHAFLACITVATTLHFLQVLKHSDRYYALPYALLSFITLSGSWKGCPVCVHVTGFESQIHIRNHGGYCIKCFSLMNVISLVSKILNVRKVTFHRNTLLRCFYCSNSYCQLKPRMNGIGFIRPCLSIWKSYS